MRWLLARAEVRGPQVAVAGSSRGGELALLLGATFEEVGAVVARVPSGVCWPGIRYPGARPDAASWTYRGSPIPEMKAVDPDLEARVYAESPVRLSQLFEPRLDDEAAVKAAQIQLERTKGPILMISGEDDAIWPSTRMAEIAMARASTYDFPFRIEHLHYPNAGHGAAGLPGFPHMAQGGHPDGFTYVFGGTPEGDAAAQADKLAKNAQLHQRKPHWGHLETGRQLLQL